MVTLLLCAELLSILSADVKTHLTSSNTSSNIRNYCSLSKRFRQLDLKDRAIYHEFNKKWHLNSKHSFIKWKVKKCNFTIRNKKT